MEHRKDEKRANLLKSALGTIRKHGIRKTTLDDIAQAAGMATTSLYYYFPNKHELLRSLMRVLIDQTIDRAAAAIEAASWPEDKLVASWKELFSAVTESGFLLDLTSVKQEVVALASDLIKDFDRRYKVLIRKIISDGVEQGVFHVNDVELAVAALSSGAVGLITTVAGEAEYEIIERRIEELGELLMNGLRKR